MSMTLPRHSAAEAVKSLATDGTRLTVVQITPLPIQSDSRTFKQAETLARAGYRSIVVEGVKSTGKLPSFSFELISPRSREGGDRDGAQQAPAARGIAARLRSLGLGPIVDMILLVLDIRQYGAQQVSRKFGEIPGADIFVLHSWYYFPMARKLARKNSKIVYDAHDAYHTLWPERASLRLSGLRRVYEFVERSCIRRADAFLTVSDGVADVIGRYFGRKPDVVRNAHDFRLDRSAKISIRDAAKVGKDDFLFVTVGNYKAGMAISSVLEALRQCNKRVHLAFLGAGYEVIEPEISALGLSGNIHILSPVAPDEVVPFIVGADAAMVTYFALTSNYEYSLPNGFFQSVAAALPMICPDLTEMRRIIEATNSGIVVDTKDPEAVLTAIRRLSEEPALYSGMKSAACAAAFSYSWEKEELGFLRAVEGCGAVAAR